MTIPTLINNALHYALLSVQLILHNLTSVMPLTLLMMCIGYLRQYFLISTICLHLKQTFVECEKLKTNIFCLLFLGINGLYVGAFSPQSC